MKDRSIPNLFFDKFCKVVHNICLPEVTKKIGICACCGDKKSIFPYKVIIKPTFPEKDIFQGGGFCDACSFFIVTKEFRMYSFILKDSPELISHQNAFKVLLTEFIPPYVISLKSPNFRRFNMLYCRVNYTSSTRRVVIYDQQEIWYDLEKDSLLFNTVDMIYNEANQTKEAIRSREYNVSKINNDEYSRLMLLDNLIAPYRSTPLLNMIIDFCQKKEEK
jgi:hypothetical protein